MGNIPPISSAAGLQSVTATQQTRRTDIAEQQQGEDRVEISSLAQSLSTMESNADIRVDKVMAIREAIANGTYETQEKIDATVDRLLQVISG